jgi:predicted SnoaL-like aldol condensation-catalyzing enzyme
MSQENKALARRFIEEAFNQANLDVIDEVLSSEWDQHDPALPDGGGHGRDHARRFVQMYRSAFPDTHIT